MKADILAKDIRWYETNVMGTGPFKFVEHVKGSHWIAKKNPDYWDKGKPYLDGYRALFIGSSSAQVAAIRGERAHIQFRGFSPADRDALVQALGPKITVQESPWNCVQLVTMNHERKPFDDKRVRRALTLAADRHEASKTLSRIAVVKEVGGIQVPGTPWATPPAELEKLAGYGRDIAASRAEARRLLREAGCPTASRSRSRTGGSRSRTSRSRSGSSISGANRAERQDGDHRSLGARLVPPARRLRRGQRRPVQLRRRARHRHPEVPVDRVSDNNYSRYKDPVLDDLFLRQARAVDPEERKRLLRASRSGSSTRRSTTSTRCSGTASSPQRQGSGLDDHPVHFLNQQLDTVWLAE